MTTTDARDLVPLDHVHRTAREAAGPGSTRTAHDLLPDRLFSGARWRLDDGEVWGQRRDAITGREHRATPELFASWVTELGALGPHDPPMTREAAERGCARLVELVHAAHAAPVRHVEVLSLARAVAGRFLRAWRCHLDRHGRVMGHRLADEPGPAQRAEQQQSGRAALPWARRPAAVGDVEITPEVVRGHCVNGVLQAGERLTDWSAVRDEIRALVAHP